MVLVAEWLSDFSICSHSLVLWAVNRSTFLVAWNSDVLSIHADKDMQGVSRADVKYIKHFFL